MGKLVMDASSGDFDSDPTLRDALATVGNLLVDAAIWVMIQPLRLFDVAHEWYCRNVRA